MATAPWRRICWPPSRRSPAAAWSAMPGCPPPGSCWTASSPPWRRPCLRTFADKQPGKTADRPELEACLHYLRPGDTLVVPSLDRLSRSLADLITLVGELRRRGAGFKSLHEALDTTTPGGRLVFHMFAALAEFIRELIVEGTREGLEAARARGQRLGRPPALTLEQVRHARALLAQPDNTVSSIARLLKVSRSTIYKYLPELGRSELPGGHPPAGACPVPAVSEVSRTPPAAPAGRLACPSCGHRPASRAEARDHRAETAMLWLHLD